MKYTVTIKQGKEVVKEVSPKVSTKEEAQEWGKRQAAAFGIPEAMVMVVENE